MSKLWGGWFCQCFNWTVSVVMLLFPTLNMRGRTDFHAMKRRREGEKTALHGCFRNSWVFSTNRISLKSFSTTITGMNWPGGSHTQACWSVSLKNWWSEQSGMRRRHKTVLGWIILAHLMNRGIKTDSGPQTWQQLLKLHDFKCCNDEVLPLGIRTSDWMENRAPKRSAHVFEYTLKETCHRS